MTFTADGKRQRWLVIFFLFLKSLNKPHKYRKMSPTIHCKYKYFHSTVQTAEDRRQKFHYWRLPFHVTSCLTSLICRIIIRLLLPMGDLWETWGYTSSCANNIFTNFAKKVQAVSRAVASKKLWQRQCLWKNYDRGNVSEKLWLRKD